MRPEDFTSATWKRLSSLLTARLQELRELNDSPSMGIERTSAIRGSIAEVKRIIALAEHASAIHPVGPGDLAGDDGFEADGHHA